MGGVSRGALGIIQNCLSTMERGKLEIGRISFGSLEECLMAADGWKDADPRHPGIDASKLNT